MAVFAFYLFGLTTLAGGLLTVTSRHPVHAVLWLILSFLGAAGLFVLLGAEFAAMLLVIVYVGAVAVLFLFVVMMLDVDFAALRAGMTRFLPHAILVALLLLVQLFVAFSGWEPSTTSGNLRVALPPPGMHNTQALGSILYDQYLLLFQLGGLILLVAMVGAIVLTLRHRSDVKRQDVLQQMHRDPARSIELRDVKPGQGL